MNTGGHHANPSLVTISHVTYFLHAIGLAIGAFGAATVAGSFVFGWPSIIAVIINYVKRGDARGTWLDSHFGWQLRTFWYAVLWVLLAGLLILTIVGIPFAWLLLVAIGIWVLYRIIRGWIALAEERPMPLPGQ